MARVVLRGGAGLDAVDARAGREVAVGQVETAVEDRHGRGGRTGQRARHAADAPDARRDGLPGGDGLGEPGLLHDGVGLHERHGGVGLHRAELRGGEVRREAVEHAPVAELQLDAVDAHEGVDGALGVGGRVAQHDDLRRGGGGGRGDGGRGADGEAGAGNGRGDEGGAGEADAAHARDPTAKAVPRTTRAQRSALTGRHSP